MEAYKSLPDLSNEVSFSDSEDQTTQEIDPLNLIEEQIEILKQIFSFGNPLPDDEEPNLEVGDH
jgi:hypothetical protein